MDDERALGQRRSFPDGRCPARTPCREPGRCPSAGSTPADEINPAVRAAITEIGIDLDGAHPKLLTTDAVQASDVVITMGCGDACPVFPGKRCLDWDLADPTGKTLDDIRPIRDDIDQRVRALLAELTT